MQKKGVTARKGLSPVLSWVPMRVSSRGCTVGGGHIFKGRGLASCSLLLGTEPAADRGLVTGWSSKGRGRIYRPGGWNPVSPPNPRVSHV